ncbi:MAG: hypothetical protein Q8910_00675 [Bacteroidota bacterium]|nr:hypothetical protein [Bacteroidota bacterium]
MNNNESINWVALSDSKAKEELWRASGEIDQLRVQLSGCSVAALGGIYEYAKPGDYGWSPAYQDVVELRRRYEELLKNQGDTNIYNNYITIDTESFNGTEDDARKFAEMIRDKIISEPK